MGEIGAGDVALVDRSFEFNDRCVADVMVGRDQIHAVRRDEPLAAALRRAVRHGHRRLPVYATDLDDIVGVVRLRDLASLARTTPDDAVEGAATAVLRTDPDQLISELPPSDAAQWTLARHRVGPGDAAHGRAGDDRGTSWPSSSVRSPTRRRASESPTAANEASRPDPRTAGGDGPVSSWGTSPGSAGRQPCGGPRSGLRRSGRGGSAGPSGRGGTPGSCPSPRSSASRGR